ncbi:LysR substrate-binding domain-containing protein [Bradyrhizobium septentrionale]|uniref:LysR family transcriptional regulator n=1 Tax=Bradyrhizobium septentrionale TaxID=1404411 RepID=A0A974A607_9BRAD|nr:LysR substrate-binding domain-containing protein [Bradyrhizobium septentrionale]UGY18430.1 LysR substrate-binding domain-containing protein [Bradyrhizobium septentrionale]UGY27197.1 LysR substrate-binding domain-containing protein [Bradyrhizobium septentrionale]
MISTDDIRFFTAIATARSLAAAARALDVTPSAVSQRLQSLEQRLGVQLVSRSARRLTLTDEGELLVLRGGALLDEATELTEALQTRRGTISGHLKILAPLGFGRRYIAPAVAAFRSRHPDVSVELELSDRPGRAAGAWDVMIHIGALTDSTLRLLRLAPNERYLCASPAYLKRRGTPASPQDLRGHDCIALRENEEDVTLWRFSRRRAAAAPDVIRIEPMLSSNDGEVVKAWALADHGLIVRSEWDVAEDLACGRLVRVLPNHRLPPADIVALLNPGRSGRARRTQAFVEHLRAALSPPPWRGRPR